jgi:hypothetical protein
MTRLSFCAKSRHDRAGRRYGLAHGIVIAFASIQHTTPRADLYLCHPATPPVILRGAKRSRRIHVEGR